MKKALLALIIFFGSFPLLASHLHGGQIYWTALGNGQYKFRLELIRQYNGSTLGQIQNITSNVPGNANISTNRISITPLTDYCHTSGTLVYEFHVFESGIINIPAPVAGTPWTFEYNFCCMPNVNAMNVYQVSGQDFHLDANMFVYGANRHSPRIDFNTIFYDRTDRNFLVAGISKNARPVQISLAPLLNTTGTPVVYNLGYTFLKPTSPQDTLLPSGLFVSGNTNASGLAILCFRAEERMPTGQMIATSRVTFGYSFTNVGGTFKNPEISVPYSSANYTPIDSNVIRIRSGMGHQIHLNLRGVVRADTNSANVRIKASLNSSSTAHLSITQPQLTNRGNSTLVDTGVINLSFDYTVPYGFPQGISRYLVHYEDENCPQNGFNTQIIEIENTGNYIFEYQVCEGDSLLLTAPITGGTYLWYPTTGMSNPNAQTTYVSPSNIQDYVLLVDGDTVAEYQFNIDKKITPSVQLNSNQQLELLNPNDYTEHQLYWFYMKVPEAKDDTTFNLTNGGLYHVRGGIKECSLYSDSVEFLPDSRRYVSTLNSFMDINNRVNISSSIGHYQFTVNFGSHYGPTSVDRIIIPQIKAQSPSNVFELEYTDTINGTTQTVTAQISADNSLVFDLTNPILAYNNQCEFKITAQSGVMYLPIVPHNGHPFGHPHAQVIQSEIRYGAIVTQTQAAQVVFSGTGDVSIPENEVNLDVYPQPAHRSLFVKSNNPKAEFSILNLNGQIVLNGTLESSSINVENLPSGMYLLKVQNNHQTTIQKIIVRH